MIPSIEHGGLIWITGLSGAGKTTLAKELVSFFNNKAILIDGDNMREILGTVDTNYHSNGRKNLAFTYAKLCNMLVNQGFLVICATISMFDDVRNYNRKNNKFYLEVFMDISKEELVKRDPKKLYADYNNNKINNMAGLDTNVEYPKNPHIIITEEYSLNTAKDLVINYLNKV